MTSQPLLKPTLHLTAFQCLSILLDAVYFRQTQFLVFLGLVLSEPAGQRPRP
jgi:hypothetical protein